MTLTLYSFIALAVASLTFFVIHALLRFGDPPYGRHRVSDVLMLTVVIGVSWIVSVPLLLVTSFLVWLKEVRFGNEPG